MTNLTLVRKACLGLLAMGFLLYGCGGAGPGEQLVTTVTPPGTTTPPPATTQAVARNLSGFILQNVKNSLKPAAGSDILVNGEKVGEIDSAGRIVALDGSAGIAAPAEDGVVVEFRSDKTTSCQQVLNLAGGKKAGFTCIVQQADPDKAGTLLKPASTKLGKALLGVSVDTEFTTSNAQSLPEELRQKANVILNQNDDWKRGVNLKVTPYQNSQNPGHAFPHTLSEGAITYKLEVLSGAKVESRFSSAPNQNQLVNTRADFDEFGFHFDTQGLASPHTHATATGKVVPRSANQMGEKGFTAVATWVCVSTGGSFNPSDSVCTPAVAPSPGARLAVWYLDLDPDKPQSSDKRWIRAGAAEIKANVAFKNQSGATVVTQAKAYAPTGNLVIPKPVPFVFVLEDPDKIDCTVSGKVTDATNNSGLPGALVLAQEGDGQANTGEDGTYSFKMTIELQGPQQLVTAKKFDGGEGAGYFDKTAVLICSQTSPNVTLDFALTQVPTTATVAGTVTKLDGSAASGATVTLKSPIVLDAIDYIAGTINFNDVVQAVVPGAPALTLIYLHNRQTVKVGLDSGATYKWEVTGGPSGLTYPFTIKEASGANTLTQVDILAAILKKLLCTVVGGVCLPTGPAVTNPSIAYLGQYGLRVTVTHLGGVTEAADGNLTLLNNLLAPTSAANFNQLNVLNLSGDMVKDRCLFATAVDFSLGAVSVSNPDGDVLRTGVTYTWKMDVTFQGNQGGLSQTIATNVALSNSRLLLYNEVEQAVLTNFAPLVATDPNCKFLGVNSPRILCGVNVVVKATDSGCTATKTEANCVATSTFGMQLGSIEDLLKRIQIGEIEFQQSPTPVFPEIETTAKSDGTYKITNLLPAVYNPLNPSVEATLAGFTPSAAKPVGPLTAGQTNTVNLQLLAAIGKVALPSRAPEVPRPA